ncbi:MAG: EF-hand domain-containing protein [Rhodobacteraceae bacterium]|nr:EF-hand domain-containing protein [Paracoccaceae bacterium]
MKTILSAALAAVMLAGAAHAQQGIPGAHFIEQWDIDGNGDVTPEEAREKRGDVFVMFDQSEDGVFQPEEWAMIDEHLTAEDAAQGQGAAMGMGKGPGQFVRAAMQAPFNDLDGDGAVTKEEFVKATDTLFGQLDRDGDGLLTVADFGRG